jgi:hypothetical protein
VVQAAVSAVIVVGVFAFAVPKFASYGSAWAVLRQLSWAQLGLLLALAALNLVTYWPRAMAAGGVGVVELTYIAGLVLAGGGGVRAAAVAATLLFRLLTYGVEIPLGGVTYLVWQRNKRWRRPLEPAEAVPLPASPQ